MCIVFYQSLKKVLKSYIINDAYDFTDDLQI